jgi:hypothetical protein
MSLRRSPFSIRNKKYKTPGCLYISSDQLIPVNKAVNEKEQLKEVEEGEKVTILKTA